MFQVLDDTSFKRHNLYTIWENNGIAIVLMKVKRNGWSSKKFAILYKLLFSVFMYDKMFGSKCNRFGVTAKQ